jgi:hypothetical protein
MTAAEAFADRTSDAPSAAGRRVRKTAGAANAGTFGTRSIREACAQLAFTSGLKRSAFRVAAGHRIRSGMRLREK